MTVPIARQCVLDLIGKGPVSMPQIAGAIMATGQVAGDKAYPFARIAVNELLTERAVQQTDLHNGTVIYHVTDKTPFEPRKDK